MTISYFFPLLLASLALIIRTVDGIDPLPGATIRFRKFCSHCLDSQKCIIDALELEDVGNKFTQDNWERRSENDVIGYGVTAVLQKGGLLEKAAVSTTFLTGVLSAERAQAMSSRRKGLSAASLVGSKYFAAALSLVLHSRSPIVPTFRADIRYFELEDGSGWFGGGGDLTPYYLFDEDAAEFHESYRNVCEKFSPRLYPQLKKWCDDYFYIPARQEHRGVGGIFFDDLDSISRLTGNVSNINPSNTSAIDVDLNLAMQFTCAVSDNFMQSYLPIVRRRCKTMYSEEQRHWQLLRRGRYIEFNLLYDRGVKFGLVPGGRVEAVMVSCPPLVAWDYNHVPVPGSEEERLQQILRCPRDWA